MAGKGSRNRSANAAYWKSSYWPSEPNSGNDAENSGKVCRCIGSAIRTMLIHSDEYFKCPRCGGLVARPKQGIVQDECSDGKSSTVAGKSGRSVDNLGECSGGKSHKTRVTDGGEV